MEYLSFAAVDIWAAGCAIGELLTGRPLLPGDSDRSQLEQVRNGRVCVFLFSLFFLFTFLTLSPFLHIPFPFFLFFLHSSFPPSFLSLHLSLLPSPSILFPSLPPSLHSPLDCILLHNRIDIYAVRMPY